MVEAPFYLTAVLDTWMCLLDAADTDGSAPRMEPEACLISCLCDVAFLFVFAFPFAVWSGAVQRALVTSWAVEWSSSIGAFGPES